MLSCWSKTDISTNESYIAHCILKKLHGVHTNGNVRSPAAEEFGKELEFSSTYNLHIQVRFMAGTTMCV